MNLKRCSLFSKRRVIEAYVKLCKSHCREARPKERTKLYVRDTIYQRLALSPYIIDISMDVITEPANETDS